MSINTALPLHDIGNDHFCFAFTGGNLGIYDLAPKTPQIITPRIFTSKGNV